MRHRGADAEREADGRDVLAFDQVLGRAQRRRLQVVRDLLRLQHREVVLRLRADDRRLGLEAVLELHAHQARPGHHVQAGEDHAFIDDHHAAAGGAVHVFVVLEAVADRAHAHDRAAHRLVGLHRRRRQRLGLERACHRLVDIVLRDAQRRRGEGAVQCDENDRERRTRNEDARFFVTLVEFAPPAARGFRDLFCLDFR